MSQTSGVGVDEAVMPGDCRLWSHVQSQGVAVKIGEVARRAGVTIDTIRFYERRGVLPAPPRRPSGYREYTVDTVDRIRLARRMQALGLSLDEIIDALSAHDTAQATCESERWRLDAALERIDARIAELKALRREIVSARTACENGRCGFVGAGGD
jgi:MerR family transcriptional regulator, copper efflux regulator